MLFLERDVHSVIEVIKSDFRNLIYLDDIHLSDAAYLFILKEIVLNRHLRPQFDDESPFKHLDERMIPFFPPYV